jgi:hypothetical protein
MYHESGAKHHLSVQSGDFLVHKKAPEPEAGALVVRRNDPVV